MTPLGPPIKHIKTLGIMDKGKGLKDKEGGISNKG